MKIKILLLAAILMALPAPLIAEQYFQNNQEIGHFSEINCAEGVTCSKQGGRLRIESESVDFDNVDINGGTIDGTRIGFSSAADATFSQITVQGTASEIAGENGYSLNFDLPEAIKITSNGFEDFNLDLETTANQATLFSTTSVTSVNFSGMSVTTTTNGANRFTVEGTSSTGATEPIIDCYHNKTAADSDDLCNNTWSGNDSLGNRTSYSLLFAEATTVADGSETGRALFQNRVAGTMTSVWEATSDGKFQVHMPTVTTSIAGSGTVGNTQAFVGKSTNIGCLMMRATDNTNWQECTVTSLGVFACTTDADGVCDGS